VIVNRVWYAHFGSGIVATPSNFGSQGSPPTHPQLLDDLAARFIAAGWSLKKLHREILLSAAWQQASASDAASLSADPDNRWLARMNRRRLDYEAWRDAMLVATGTGDFRIGGPSIPLDDPGNFRRTLYATIHRRDMSTTLTVHDFPDPTQHSPARTPTITAIQGLYALNGPLLIAQAEEMTRRIFASGAAKDRDRIREIYRRLFLRLPTKRELDIGIKFLAENGSVEDSAATASAQRWQQYVHVLLASNEFSFLD